MAVSKATKRMERVPNILTVCRILAAPVLVVLLSFPTPLNRALAALLFILASVTDYLDGYLARRYEVTSSVGKLLDPMAPIPVSINVTRTFPTQALSSEKGCRAKSASSCK